MKLSAAIAGLTLAGAPAVMARTRTSRTRDYPPPPPPPYEDLNTESGGTTTTTHSSSASCTITGKTTSTSTGYDAVEAGARLLAYSWNTYCTADPVWDLAGNITDTVYVDAKAVATVMIELKRQCEATSDGMSNAYACGSAWADAESFANACIDLAVQSIAEIDSRHCMCSTAVFADAGAMAVVYGDVFSSIYVAADLDLGCAEAGNGVQAAEVDQTMIVDCTATAVATAVLKATAEVWRSSNCAHVEPAVCDTCCYGVAPDGYYCKCEDCKNDHIERANLFVEAMASANFNATESGTVCTGTLQDNLNPYTDPLPVTPEPHTYMDLIGGDGGTSSCNIFMESQAVANAVSDYAKATIDMATALCDADFEKMSDPYLGYGAASAMVEVWQHALAECSITGNTDVTYAEDGSYRGDTACGIADVWGHAFAEACASAIASAVAQLESNPTCACGGDLKLFGEAYANKTLDIFAQLQQWVSVDACADTYYGTSDVAEINRTCTIETTAALSAHAMLSIYAENPMDCLTNPPQLCVDKCNHVAYADKVEDCVAACAAETQRNAEVVVDASQTIVVSADKNPTCSVTGEPEGYYWFKQWADTGISPTRPDGKVTAIVRWDGSADVDLYLKHESGQTWYAADTGGDAYCYRTGLQEEYVVLSAADAPAGYYSIYAVLKNPHCDHLPVEYTVVGQIDGVTKYEKAFRFEYDGDWSKSDMPM